MEPAVNTQGNHLPETLPVKPEQVAIHKSVLEHLEGAPIAIPLADTESVRKILPTGEVAIVDTVAEPEVGDVVIVLYGEERADLYWLAKPLFMKHLIGKPMHPNSNADPLVVVESPVTGKIHGLPASKIDHVYMVVGTQDENREFSPAPTKEVIWWD